MLHTVTEATVGLHLFMFTLHHYLLLTLALSDIKWSQVSTCLYCTMSRTVRILHCILPHFLESCFTPVTPNLLLFQPLTPYALPQMLFQDNAQAITVPHSRRSTYVRVWGTCGTRNCCSVISDLHWLKLFW